MNEPENGTTSPHSAPGATSATTRLALALLANELSAWLLVPGRAPRSLPLHNQPKLNVKQAQDIAAAYHDVTERLRDEGTNIREAHCLADAAGRNLWVASLPLLEQLPPWQLLAWEWLAERFGLGDALPRDVCRFIENELLPWLVVADDAAERQQMREARDREHHSESERLAAERHTMQQENKRLREQNVALQQVDAERLVCYLPAIFPRVFTVLGATDLALLCGRVEPLPIPSPYPEPSRETLFVLQKDFKALPLKLQRQIVAFVARLPQRQKLQPHPEMRDLLRELEQD